MNHIINTYDVIRRSIRVISQSFVLDKSVRSLIKSFFFKKKKIFSNALIRIMANYAEIFRPFVKLFTIYMSGIMTVDMFITAIIASGISLALYTFFKSIATGNSWRMNDNVTVQVEYYTAGTYCDLQTSIFYEALSWLISQQTKKLNEGSFFVQH